MFEQQAVSQDDLDIAESEQLNSVAAQEAANAQIESAKAGIKTSEAAISTAQVGVQTGELNLSYTLIRSPIDGRISKENVTEGNLISGGSELSTLLTTVVSIDPIHCYFDANEQEFLKYARLAKEGKRESSRDVKNPAYLALIDETGFPHLGHMDFVDNAFIVVIPPPPVPGIGTGGGFKMQIQDRSGAGLMALQEATNAMIEKARQQQGLVQVYSSFDTGTPQYYADIDRTKVRMLNVPIDNVFSALQIYLGSSYVNDFNFLGRTYRVTVQADEKFRDEASDIQRLRTRSSTGAIVPLGSVITLRSITAPERVVRYNLYPSADLNGDTLPNYSSGQAIATMERIAEETLPAGFGYEWTDLAYQQKAEGNTAIYIFPLCVLFVFLALSAQYESWGLPLAVILIVPLCLLAAIFGVWLRGMNNDILVQIGFVVLVGLACKNAILIVEFAKAEEDAGKNRSRQPSPPADFDYAQFS